MSTSVPVLGWGVAAVVVVVGGGGGGVGAFGGLQYEGMEDRQAYLTSLLATSP